jgi:hypothetical protein
MMGHRGLAVLAIVCGCSTLCRGQDAAQIYAQAAAAIKVDSPSEAAVVYPDYPISSPDWLKVEKAAWDANGEMRRLARQARSVQRADWSMDFSKSLMPLNALRRIANQLGDAAYFATAQGDDAEALEFIRDARHLADLLGDTPVIIVRQLVGAGIEALALDRLEEIAAGATLTDDPGDKRRLSEPALRQMISELLNQREPAVEAMEAIADGGRALEYQPNLMSRLIRTFKRIQMEQGLAAMSLACQVFRFEKNHWPDSLDDLIPAYLPHAIADPFGNGQQALGYVLIVGGLPDGSDRPLVYSRSDSTDGMFYITNDSLYGYYAYDQTEHGGQFRDVARWTATAVIKGPTTRPLPAIFETIVEPAPVHSEGAATIYLQAAAAMRVTSGTFASRLLSVERPNFPPHSLDWMSTEAKAWKENRESRQLVRSAANVSEAVWPSGDFNYLWSVYTLGTDLGDAALFAEVNGHHAEAAALIDDQFHMAEALEGNPSTNVGRAVIAAEIRTMAADRLPQIISFKSMAQDAADAQAVPAAAVREWIARLLEQRDPAVQFAQANNTADGRIVYERERVEEILKQANCEQSLAAMALASQLFHLDKGRWPVSLEELVPAYLPKAMIDPWGDGKQTLGYVLIKGSLPDGDDRPLVYTRRESSDGLFYIDNKPESFYYEFSEPAKDFSPDRPMMQSKNGGQFRDVVRWEPMDNDVQPTTRPLNPL